MALNRNIAFIDLDRNTVDISGVPVEWRRKFLGGKGLSAYLLCKHVPKGCDPPAAESVAVLGAGLLAGTLTSPLGYGVIMARSPLTDMMGCTFSGGPFFPEMRRAGFDYLILKGRAKRPVYLFVNNGDIEIRDVSKVGGKDVFESRDMIRKIIGDEETQILCVGVADEKRVRFTAASAGGGVTADRSGMGIVLGAKNIQAIACRGTLDIEVKDPEGILRFERRILEQVHSEKALSGEDTGGTFSGAAGRVTRQELEETIAHCLGIPHGKGANPNADANVFRTLREQIRLNTGLDMDEGDLKGIAYRCITLERLFNLREGGAHASDRRNGWTKTAVLKKGKVFDRLGIRDLWPLFRANP